MSGAFAPASIKHNAAFHRDEAGIRRASTGLHMERKNNNSHSLAASAKEVAFVAAGIIASSAAIAPPGAYAAPTASSVSTEKVTKSKTIKTKSTFSS